MTDPRRLLEDGTDFERELLDSARVDAPSPARRRRLLATAAATGTALATATASGAGIATWKVIIGLAAIGSVAVAVTRDPHDKITTVDPPPSALARPTIAVPTIAPSVLAPIAIAAPSTIASVSASVQKTIDAKAPSESAALNLAREVAWIDAARAAIRAHDGPKALQAVDGYEREFAGGSLAVEASVLRIEGTALSGDGARASKLARAFLAAHPGSPYATRVSKHLEDD